VVVKHFSLPSFVQFEDNQYTASPNMTTIPAPYKVSGALSDGIMETKFDFTIIVLESNSTS
jgi:hypothetical protein